MALDSKKTAVILLGASAFPNATNFQASGAFPEAKGRIKGYFENTVCVDPSRIADLFDSTESADNQDKHINDFISAQVTDNVQDLFIYYVGHGGFTPSENTFYLAINRSRQTNAAVSSLTIPTLAHTIKNQARNIRTFIILDCCFAAAAGKSFMSDDHVVAAQLKTAFASKGIVLMCATSKDSPAYLVKARNITMFTEGLDYALTKGDSSISNPYLDKTHQNDPSWPTQKGPLCQLKVTTFAKAK